MAETERIGGEIPFLKTVLCRHAHLDKLGWDGKGFFFGGILFVGEHGSVERFVTLWRVLRKKFRRLEYRIEEELPRAPDD